MRPVRILLIVGGLAVLLSLAVVVGAQHTHGYSGNKGGVSPGSRQTERVALELSEQDSAGMKLTMREHMDSRPSMNVK